MRAKSILKSRTVWSVIGLAAYSVMPKVEEISNSLIAGEPVNFNALGGLAFLLLFTFASVWYRIDAKQSLYTPEFLPGPNKRDLQ